VSFCLQTPTGIAGQLAIGFHPTILALSSGFKPQRPSQASFPHDLFAIWPLNKTNYDIIELLFDRPRSAALLTQDNGKGATLMATIEERLQALEQENAARKKAEELLTIAVRALVSKEAFEKLQDTVEKSQEQYGKLFDVLNNHNIFTNQRLADIQDRIIALDGKTVGLQTETRQRFAQIDQHFAQIEATQYEHTTALTEQKNLLTEILARLPEKP
jgi:hypothetical protein